MRTSRLQDRKRFFEPAKVEKRSLVFTFCRAVQMGLMGTLVAYFMKSLLDAAVVGNYTSAFIYLARIGSVFLLGDVLGYFARYYYVKWKRNTQKYLYQKYMTDYFLGDNNAREAVGTGKANSIMLRGIDTWSNRLYRSVNVWTRIAVALLSSLLLIFMYVGILWSFVAIAGMIICYIFVLKANKLLRNLRTKRRDIIIETDKQFVRMIMSKQAILMHEKIEHENHYLYWKFVQILDLSIREIKMKILTFDLQRVLFSLMRVGAIAYFLYLLQINQTTIGTLAAVRMLLNTFYVGMLDMTDGVTEFLEEKVKIEKLWSTFGDIWPIRGYTSGEMLSLREWSIAFKKVSYSYGKGEVLKNFSLELEWWKKTALVGVSGSGKSTLIKLIAGYIHPKSGEVLIDGQPLPNETNEDHVSLKSYYKHIGYLTQEPNVFDGSIYDNLTYALDYQPTQEELDTAIQWAQCQFIYDFPEGVQTEIGEKGIKLSGGQRQRLAIAKVMLKNPQIILLDEPTSALDSFSEEEVTKAFNNLFEWRTVIVIAHRLQTVKNADRIIVLDQGKIVEEGNHNSLVEKGGVYAKMLELQSWF